MFVCWSNRFWVVGENIRFEVPELKKVGFSKCLYMPVCIFVCSVASEPLNVIWPNLHQTCISSQLMGARNYFENQHVFWAKSPSKISFIWIKTAPIEFVLKNRPWGPLPVGINNPFPRNVSFKFHVLYLKTYQKYIFCKISVDLVTIFWICTKYVFSGQNTMHEK